ncbi:hypothetical protein JCGZ_19151 [Jatropha curcas]|uniref:Late embryogenesis abundant protein LEA-2 subgroup domain-containing protein n=1 Tax=Jatropha curcas TaxID=180498 RepID=A0A067KDF5_JATCU|nr:hypothetical protein JCGZ_19151 [Jatropha curcas]
MSKTSTNLASDCLFGLLFFAALVLLISAPAAVTWLLIRLQPSVPEVKLQSSSLSVLNNASCNSRNTITAEWKVTLSIKHPNSKAISYDRIKAQVSGPEVLGHSNDTILPFEQKGGVQESRKIRATFTNVLLQFNNCAAIANTVVFAVNLTTQLHVRAEYKGWTWPVQRDLIQILCSDYLKIDNFPSETTASSRGRNCLVNGNWKRMVTKWNSFVRHYIFLVFIFLLILALSM